MNKLKYHYYYNELLTPACVEDWMHHLIDEYTYDPNDPNQEYLENCDIPLRVIQICFGVNYFNRIIFEDSDSFIKEIYDFHKNKPGGDEIAKDFENIFNKQIKGCCMFVAEKDDSNINIDFKTMPPIWSMLDPVKDKELINYPRKFMSKDNIPPLELHAKILCEDGTIKDVYPYEDTKYGKVMGWEWSMLMRIFQINPYASPQENVILPEQTEIPSHPGKTRYECGLQ